MKRLAGWALYALVVTLAKLACVLRLVTRPVRWVRLKVVTWRINSLCRRIARQQRRLARLLNLFDRIESK